MSDAINKVMSVGQWRTLDALASPAVNEAIKACCQVKENEINVGVQNLVNALQAGCAHRDNLHSRSYFRIHQVAFALFQHPERMKDAVAEWVRHFVAGQEGVDGSLSPYLNKDQALGHLVEMSASQNGPGGVEMLRIVSDAASGLDWLQAHQKSEALDRAIQSGNVEVIHELLGRQTVFDATHPLPGMKDPRNVGFVTIDENQPVNLLLHAAKSIIGVGDEGGADGQIKIKLDRLESFEAIRSHLARDYLEPYHEMFEWMSHNVRHMVPAMRQRAIPDAVVFLGLGATPRPGKAKQAWTQLLRTKTEFTSADLGEVRMDIPVVHSMINSGVDRFVPAALQRMVREGGLDVDSPTKKGVTLLMRAARLNKSDAVETLLDLGADATRTAVKVFRSSPDKSYDAAAMAELAGNHDLASKLRAHVARAAILSVVTAAKAEVKR